MSFTTIQNSFATGEISPSLLGRTDLNKWHSGALTMRNFFVNYRGGASSRAGTVYVGTCGQSGSASPPRLIPFKFSLNESFVLEFGNLYVRIIYNGGYVTSSGSIYSIVSPYSVADLPYLKYVQSADVMTITCINPHTAKEYPIYELKRYSNINWTFSQISFGSTISPPSSIIATAKNSTTVTTYYSYKVTAVSTSGDESIASGSAACKNNDIDVYEGSNTIGWASVTGATKYNVYKTFPGYNSIPSSYNFYGYMCSSTSTTAIDSNITPDLSTSPPVHYDPFGKGVISGFTISSVGSGLPDSITVKITSSTGSGFTGYCNMVDDGLGTSTYSLLSITILTGGSNYKNTDTVVFTAATGTIPHATISSIEDGSYPSVCTYFQQRRVYANTFAAPDTYYMSKPGFFYNFDSGDPINSGDAIIGTPWAQQVSGIQWLVPTQGGLLSFTGNGAWLINGGDKTAVTPSDQSATPQTYNGCSPTVPPLTIGYEVLYNTALGSSVRDLSFNFYTNKFVGTDLTILSNHLFTNSTINEWSYAEEPYKIVWAVRDDGTMLSFTFLKDQEIYGWSRHDTNGEFISVCSISEPPVDATYFIVRRHVGGSPAYYIERMDNRLWDTVEDCVCSDCSLQLVQTKPSATLTASQSGIGTGVVFTASSGVFTSGNVGDVIRVGGGKATVTAYTSGTVVVGTITTAISDIIPNDPNKTPRVATIGNWSITKPVTTISGLSHLEGKSVVALADGNVITNLTVLGGSITLPQPASQITVGLSFTAQLQTTYLDVGSEPVTVQGRRKNIYKIVARMDKTRGLKYGSNKEDASCTVSGIDSNWDGMVEFPERTKNDYMGVSIPLYTGDRDVPITANWGTRGQIAFEQDYPLPANVLAVVAFYQTGDTPG